MTELALGAAVIEVVATDVAGNVGSAQVAVTVDGGPLIGFFIDPFGLGQRRLLTGPDASREPRHQRARLMKRSTRRECFGARPAEGGRAWG